MKEYSVKQISEMLGTQEETVRRWIRNNKMHAVKTSRKEGNLVPEAELNQFLISKPKYLERFVKASSLISPEAALPIFVGGYLAESVRDYIKSRKKKQITEAEFKRFLNKRIRELKKQKEQTLEQIYSLQKEAEKLDSKINSCRFLLENEDILERRALSRGVEVDMDEKEKNTEESGLKRKPEVCSVCGGDYPSCTVDCPLESE